jgi:hypothetical protein
MSRSSHLVCSVVAIGFLLASGAPAWAQACGASTTAVLVAGQHYSSGTISIFNDAANIYVQYHLDAPWVMSDAHVAVASTLSGIPQTRTGNPIPGRFPYSATFDPEVTSYTFGIPTAGNFVAGQPLFIAAHAMVLAPKDFGGSQTGWGSGPNFPGANWATYINYTVQACGGGQE